MLCYNIWQYHYINTCILFDKIVWFRRFIVFLLLLLLFSLTIGRAVAPPLPTCRVPPNSRPRHFGVQGAGGMEGRGGCSVWLCVWELQRGSCSLFIGPKATNQNLLAGYPCASTRQTRPRMPSLKVVFSWSLLVCLNFF